MPGIRHKADVAFEDGRIVVRPGGGVWFSSPVEGKAEMAHAKSATSAKGGAA
jgi:hypothetical protein